MSPSKPRVLHVLEHYPEVAETYVLSELEALRDDFDVRVIASESTDAPCRSPVPYEIVPGGEAALRERIEDFRPMVIHSHWLRTADTMLRLAEQTGVPFTIRTHSFDVMPIVRSIGWVSVNQPRWLSARRVPDVRAVNSDHCLGILAFPFKRGILERQGVKPEKIVECWSVVNYERFHDRSPNEPGVMNMGAALPKKRMEDFLHLATLVPDKPFRLYAIAYQTERIIAKRDEMNSPVEIVDAVEPTEMKREYKRHDWLVYTSAFELNSIGWPMAVAEAQAAGLGVAVANVRPDVREYAGPAAVVYDSVEELPGIVSKPVPEETREAGFEHAKKSDVKRHISLLTDLWAPAAEQRQAA